MTTSDHRVATMDPRATTMPPQQNDLAGAEESDSLWHSFDLGRAHIVGVSTEAFYYQVLHV